MGKVLVYGAIIVTSLGIGLLIGGLSVHYTKPSHDELTVGSREAVCFPRANRGVGGAIAGTIELSQIQGMPLKISVDVAGLPKSKLGFHIHQFGVVDNDCAAAGSHYNPKNQSHGGPSSPERHIGDLGNIDVKELDFGKLLIEDSVATLFGKYSVLGRSIVIHEREDDLEDQSSAGPRLACCTIMKGTQLY